MVLIFLTFDTVMQISTSGKRMPAFSEISNRIEYKFYEKRNFQVSVID
ncbi:MAG: hypothetical protein WC073_15050 [Sterolibacterium sp.]